MLSRETETLCEIHKVEKNLYQKDFKYSPLASPIPDATRVDCTIQQVHLGKPKNVDQLESHYTSRGWTPLRTTPRNVKWMAQQVGPPAGTKTLRHCHQNPFRVSRHGATHSDLGIFGICPSRDSTTTDTTPDGSCSNYRKLPDHILTRPGRDAACGYGIWIGVHN